MSEMARSGRTVDPGPQPPAYDAQWVRAKYEFERTKRLRPDAVDQYVEVTADFSHFFLDCTPSYLSSEGNKDDPHGMLASNFGGKPTDFFDMLRGWRVTGQLDGVTFG